MTRQAFFLFAAMGVAVGCTKAPVPSIHPPLPVLSTNAPKDQPVEWNDAAEKAECDAAMAPLIAKARQTWPDAKKRYLEGLPRGHVFYVVKKLVDGKGNTEQVFVAVTSIRNDKITGRIASEILGQSGFKQGDVQTFPESELIDWLISRPDGSEEGNLVGNFLDEWQKTHRKK